MKSLHLVKANTPGLSKEARPFLYHMENFQFANFPVRPYLFDSVLLDDYSGGGVLGLDFFSRFDQFRLNPIDNTLCFNHFDNSKKMLRFLTLEVDNGNIVVSSDIDSVYLKKTGLKKGDVIVSINNIQYPLDQVSVARDVALHSKTLDLEINRNGKISHLLIN